MIPCNLVMLFNKYNQSKNKCFWIDGNTRKQILSLIYVYLHESQEENACCQKYLLQLHNDHKI